MRAAFTDVPCEASTSSHGRSTSELNSSKLLEPTLRRSPQNGCVNLEFRKNHLSNHSNASAFSNLQDMAPNDVFCRYGSKKMQCSQEPVSCIKAKEPVDKTQLNDIVPSHFNERSLSLSFREMQSSDWGKAIEASFHVQLSYDCNKGNDGIILCNPMQDGSFAFHSVDASDSVCQILQFGFMSMPILIEAIPYQSFSTGYDTILQLLFYHESSNRSKSSTPSEKIKVQVYADGNNCYDSRLMNHIQRLEYHRHEENYRLYDWRRDQVEENLGDLQDLSHIPVEDIYKDCGISRHSKTTETVHAAIALESGNESGVHNSCQKGLDSDQSRREAALIKFRLKSIDRCFEKKVRYHSMKKLAEQRLRVKGQFVCQNIIDLETTRGADD